MAYAPSIVPWKIGWSEYAQDEEAHAIFLVRADKRGIPVFAIIYAMMSLALSDMSAGATAASTAQAPAWKTFVQLALAVLAAYVLAVMNK